MRVVVQHDMDQTRRGMLAAELGLDEADVFEKKGLLATRDLLSLIGLEIPALRDPPHHPVDQTLSLPSEILPAWLFPAEISDIIRLTSTNKLSEVLKPVPILLT